MSTVASVSVASSVFPVASVVDGGQLEESQVCMFVLLQVQ